MVNTLDGKPIGFFLNHSGIDKDAKRFYRGELGVGDGNTLNGIADSLISCSLETKPFYFFIFNQIVELSNGEYEEFVASKCKEFLEMYPCEFFHSFNQPELNINVVKWTNYIGITLKDRGSFSIYRTRVDSTIKARCPDIQDLLKSFMVEVRMCLVR
ncbi:MAG: hypothetical protein EHM93_05345 [Bacteroidales bacterium]|nr:MAG: hypothetical protein EHM93_05345 [Bacteroidales bacterium]